MPDRFANGKAENDTGGIPGGEHKADLIQGCIPSMVATLPASRLS